MAKKPKISRSSLPTQSPDAAGNTPTAASEQEAPSSQVAAQVANSGTAPEAKPVGDILNEQGTAFGIPPAPVFKASEAPAAATAQPVKENAVATPRRGGASWFIPPRQPSQFGVKKS